MSLSLVNSCVFCQISNRISPATILYGDDEIMVFRDIKPAADNHYLCIPKNHVRTVKDLSAADKPLLERLVSIGQRILIENGGDVNDVLMGFHWPPFNSVPHLHLHVISPASKMNFLSKQIFKPHNLWFVTSDYALNYVQNKLWYSIVNY